MVDTTGFVSALVVNAAIAVVAFILFLIWRPKYPWCFDSRRVPKKRVVGIEPPTPPAGAFGWLAPLIRLPDGQFLASAGLDAVMFVKFFELCATLFLALCVFGIGILLPVNYTSTNGNISDSFDQLSMANIPTGNRRFWAHLIIGYMFSITFYYLCWNMWKEYLDLKHQHLMKWTLLGGNHTLMIHELPVELRSDDALLAYFQKQFPGQIRSATMAKDLSMKKDPPHNTLESLPENVQARDGTAAALEHDVIAWEKKQADPKIKPEKKAERAKVGTMMFCLDKKDAIDHHYSELQRLNGLVASKKQEYIVEDGGKLGADGKKIPTLLSGFVTFHSARSCVAAANAFVYDTTPFSFEAKQAPELRDIYWPSLNMTKRQRSARTILFNVITGALILFWMIPMGFLMGVSNLQGLQEKYSWLDWIQEIPNVILGFIEAYLPAILLVVFFALLPKILLAFSKMQGIEAWSWLQVSVIHKYFLFMVVNFFFGAIVGGAIFSNISELLGDVNSIPRVLGEQIPTVSNYFVNYVALAAFAGFPLQMAQVGRLIVGGIMKKYFCVTKREFEAAEAPPALDYGVAYCPHLFIFLVAMTYAQIAPIIIPFAAVYFCLGYVVFKYQLLWVYVQPFESGGTFWTVVYSKMSSALLIAQICLVGILGLKEVPAQAVLVVPLPILTLIFDRYVHNAIKVKLKSLPLSRLVEIDTLHRAERAKRESNPSSPRNVQVDASPQTMPLEETPEKPQPMLVESKQQEGAMHHAAGGALQKSPRPVLSTDEPPRLGFPYSDDDQDRAWCECDVPAYIQPEITDAVPATVHVERAEMYLSEGGNARAAAAAVATDAASGAKIIQVDEKV